MALAAGVVVVFFAVTLITLTHVVTNSASGCSISEPAPSLPAALRSLGGFDQSFDASNPTELAQVGQAAAAAVIPNLDGAIAERPVNVTAAVVGNRRRWLCRSPPRRRRREACAWSDSVSFYVGCGGRAYFGSVTDVASPGPSNALAFPTVGESAAAQQLATSTPQLVYTTSPFMPEWRNAQSGATIPAGE